MHPDTGKRVAARRREVGFTQHGLAQAVGCGRATIARIEAGHLPNLKLAFAIARKLRTSVDDLFAVEPPPKPRLLRASEIEGPSKRSRPEGKSAGPATTTGGKSRGSSTSA